MRRTDLMDTSERIHREMILLLRAKSPAWRIRKVFDLNRCARQLREATRHLRPPESR
jgi:hypothetical protein